MVDAFKHYGGTIGGYYGLMDSLKGENNPDQPGEDPEYSYSTPKKSFGKLGAYHDERAKYQYRLKKTSTRRMLVMMLMKNVDMMWFKGLQTYLHNQYIRGLPQYLNDLFATYAMTTSHWLTATTTPTRTETCGISLLQKSTGYDQTNTGQGQKLLQRKSEYQLWGWMETYMYQWGVTVLTLLGITQAIPQERHLIHKWEQVSCRWGWRWQMGV